MKAKSYKLTDTGKPVKIAVTTIMRKLIVLAIALLKANPALDPKTVSSKRVL
jgi:hypothetical protein